MMKAVRRYAICAALSVFASLAASAPTLAGGIDECTDTVAHTPEYQLTFTQPGRSGRELVLSLDMDTDLAALLGGEAGLQVTASMLEGDDSVLAPSGELVLVATGEDTWTWSYRLSETYGEPEIGAQSAELHCGSEADIPI